jgi:hypothetical protein
VLIFSFFLSFFLSFFFFFPFFTPHKWAVRTFCGPPLLLKISSQMGNKWMDDSNNHPQIWGEP